MTHDGLIALTISSVGPLLPFRTRRRTYCFCEAPSKAAHLLRYRPTVHPMYRR